MSDENTQSDEVEDQAIELDHTEVNGLFIGPNYEHGVVTIALSKDENTAGLVSYMSPPQVLDLIAGLSYVLKDLTQARKQQLEAAMDAANDQQESELILPPSTVLS